MQSIGCLKRGLEELSIITTLLNNAGTQTELTMNNQSHVHHIKQLDNTNPTKQVYSEQNKYGWPELDQVSESKSIMEIWKISDITKSKDNIFIFFKWKNIVRK